MSTPCHGRGKLRMLDLPRLSTRCKLYIAMQSELSCPAHVMESWFNNLQSTQKCTFKCQRCGAKYNIKCQYCAGSGHFALATYPSLEDLMSPSQLKWTTPGGAS